MALKSNPVVKRLVQTGEAQVGKIVQQVLANEKFVAGIQTVVQTTLTAKGAFDRNIRMALSAMNLPSTQDLEQLRNKVGELEVVLVKLDEKVNQLLEKH
ncbi:MAG: hypothetical protein JST54_19435 [Deltaproteobacteria bacterium]|nr:hypothetical protein [Deltaproteobacteria bacterium]